MLHKVVTVPTCTPLLVAAELFSAGTRAAQVGAWIGDRGARSGGINESDISVMMVLKSRYVAESRGSKRAQRTRIIVTLAFGF